MDPSREPPGDPRLDLGQLQLECIDSYNYEFDVNHDCVLYACIACLEYFGYSSNLVSNDIVSMMDAYLNSDSPYFEGRAKTLGRAIDILLKRYCFRSVGKVSRGDDYDFIAPALCRVGRFNAIGTHCVFIANKKVYCVEEEMLEGFRVYECRRLEKKQ